MTHHVLTASAVVAFITHGFMSGMNRTSRTENGHTHPAPYLLGMTQIDPTAFVQFGAMLLSIASNALALWRALRLWLTGPAQAALPPAPPSAKRLPAKAKRRRRDKRR